MQDTKAPVELERHYSPAEVAKQWGISVDTVRRIFADAPGVLKIGHAESKSKGKYVTLRIPERILRAHHARLSTEAA
jgi:AraC-like DNA-binding protein